MKIKILYAEDDEFTRKFEIRRLKECGFNVSSVEDGQEDTEWTNVRVANVSILDESYSIYFKPLTFEL